MTLGENIKKQRERLKLSQEYVAEQLGVSRQAVSKWETGQSEPTAGNLVQLAKVFEISLSELADPEGADGQGGARLKQQAPKQPNFILRANLIKIAIAAQAAFLFNSASMFRQMQDAESPMKDLYRGALFVSLALLALSSAWMAFNHRWEEDLARRRKNANIELGYCCVQLAAWFLTVRFGLGLVGAAIIIAVCCVYVLYINPRFMHRKLTK